jgi:carbamoyltransferase
LKEVSVSLVLGIANTSHDSSAALFRDGRLIAAISEERLSRIKCDGGAIPQRAIDSVLALAGAKRTDVDAIGLIHANYPEEYFARPSALKELERKLSRMRRKLAGGEGRIIWSNHVLKEARDAGVPVETLFRQSLFLEREGFRPDARTAFFDHHDIHAILAAFYSGFGDCTTLTMDGEGDLGECHTSGVFRNGKLERRHVTVGLARSAGHFYMAITQLLGFRPLRHEGKVLGLAAFGDPKPLHAAFTKALRLASDGATLASDFASDDECYEHLKSAIQGYTREQVAAAAQQVLEDTVVPLVRRASP